MRIVLLLLLLSCLFIFPNLPISKKKLYLNFSGTMTEFNGDLMYVCLSVRVSSEDT